MTRPVLAVTAGDVAGIGPEVVVRAMAEPSVQDCSRPLIICHPEVLQEAVRTFGFSNRFTVLEVADVSADSLGDLPEPSDGVIPCWNPAGDAVLSTTRAMVDAAAGDAAFQYLNAAIDLALNKSVAGIVTAPLNKAALHAAGHHWPGHTEILADRCEVDDFAMMLHLPDSAIASFRDLIDPAAAGQDNCGLSIAHVTLHTSVDSVPSLLSESSVAEKIQLLVSFLDRIGCSRGAVGVCALNPHGGENGLFGDEEQRIITPAVKQFQGSGRVKGPLPVDTLIRRAILGEFDGVVAMYHDQGHIPIKLIGFDAAINITLGLPIIRTSPTHGTAFDRAWQPDLASDAAGMTEAIRMAARLAEGCNSQGCNSHEPNIPT